MDPRLLRLYEQELAFVRDSGAEFAREHPKIASRLDMSTLDVTDPYIERLLEGFAFLTARVQLKLESEFGTFTQSLLQMVYPHYLAPTPSMTVVRFEPDASLRAMPEGMVLPRGTELRSLLGTEDQTNCEFRTAHDVQLLPVEVVEASYLGSSAAVAALGLPEQPGVRAAIRLRLRTSGDMPFAALALDRLPFFLGGADGSRMRLYEQLVADLTAMWVRPGTRPVSWQERLPATCLSGIGFEEDEALLPRTPQSFDGYRLLQEYYAMPERFLFVELGGLGRAVSRCATNELEVLLLLRRADPALASGFGVDQMQLFCTPAINLFSRRSDRINLNEQDSEHLVVPDRMRQLDFEVFSVTGVEGYSADGSPPVPFLPFYTASDLGRDPGPRAYFTTRRRPHLSPAGHRYRGRRSNYVGHDCTVALVDAEEAPYRHGLRQLGLDLLCTNRDLPLSMPIGKQHTDFTLSGGGPVAAIRSLVGPTAPRPCRSDGEYAWRFISHLSLNHLSLADTDSVQGAAALRALLRLYVPSATASEARQLDGLLSVESRPVVRRIPGAGPIAAGRGLQLRLMLDEGPFDGAGGILLAAVLDRFFSKYVSINAFVETVMHSSERGEVKRWPIRLGRRPVL